MELPVGPQPDSNRGANARPRSSFGPDRTPYDVLGGDERVRELVDRFYRAMDRESEFAAVRAIYPEELEGPRERLYMFLSGWLGGPQLYVQRHGHPRLRARHLPFAIGETERDQWLACMRRAMDEMDLDDELDAFLEERFAHVARFMQNR